jgi:hypothetical protein
MRARIHHLLTCLSVTAVLATAVAPAEAATSPGSPQLHSFEGSCAIVGNAVLAHPMGLTPRRSSFEFKGRGHCQGTLDGRVLPESGAPVRLISAGPRPIHTCELGYDPGITFAMTFYPGRARRATIVGDGEIVDVGRGQYSVVRGQRSGIAAAVNTLQGHMETVMRCAKGTLRGGTVGLQIDTLTPLVSEEPRSVRRGPPREARPRRPRGGN